MIKVSFENGKEFQKKLERIGSSLSRAKGEILKAQEMLPKTEVADSDLKALYDALYKAKLENDIGKMQVILEEIEKISEVTKTVVEEELGKRAIAGFVEKMVK
ncbi:MAG: hypothetical protein HOG49_02775 [Candidatus Scalindua sp.]|nr:hypothetical protein [Candidatus Scalindua sp.]